MDSSRDTVESYVKASLSTKVLVSALTSSFISAYLTTGEFSATFETLPGVMMSVGAPAAIGQLIVTAVDPSPPKDTQGQLFKAVVGGSAGVAFMIASGALPAVVDTQTLSLVGVLSLGIYVGDMFEAK